MPIKIRKGGVWQDITAGKVFANGSWRSLIQIKVYKGGSWRTVANFTAPAEPPPSTGGSGGGGGGGTITVTLNKGHVEAISSNSVILTEPVTATPSGGRAPYTYAWSIVSHDTNATYSIVSPTVATTQVKAVGIPEEDSGTATFHCVVTDSLGTTATSATIPAGFTHITPL